MKWYKPKEAVKEIKEQSNALATIAIMALVIATVAIFIAIGKDHNAAH